MVLQSLMVDLFTSQNERQTVASERPFGVPSVCVRFIVARLNLIQNHPLLTKVETA
jgi:hypothetical protein